MSAVRGGWLYNLIGLVVAVLVATLLAPLIPSPGSQIVAVLAWIVAVVFAILLLVGLLRGGSSRV